MEEINNENWTPLRKLWRKLKIIRGLSSVEPDKDRKDYLKEWEIEISKKIVMLSRTVTDKNRVRITIPFFPILGSKQDG